MQVKTVTVISCHNEDNQHPSHVKIALFLASGDILIWNLKTKSSTCIAPAHNRIIFNISHDSAAKKFVTTSMDRQVIEQHSILLKYV